MSVAFALEGEFGAPSLFTISQVLARFGNIINLTIVFIIGLAVFMIIYGIFTFVTNPADEEARGKAKGFIIWGIIAVFLMVSVWGIVNILVNSFSTDPVGGRKSIQDALVPVVGSGPFY